MYHGETHRQHLQADSTTMLLATAVLIHKQNRKHHKKVQVSCISCYG